MILVAHPLAPVRDGMAIAFRSELGVSDVVHAASRHECLGLARSARPEVAILDVDVEPGAAPDLCAAVRAHEVPVVMTTRTGDADLLDLLRAGADGVVLADAGMEGLLTAVRTVLEGHAYVPPHLLGTVLRGLIVQRRAVDAAAARVSRLTSREREVLGLLAAGADKRQIAARLFISPNTAKKHIQHLLEKLEVRSRVEAAALAVSHGVTAPDLEAVND